MTEKNAVIRAKRVASLASDVSRSIDNIISHALTGLTLRELHEIRQSIKYQYQDRNPAASALLAAVELKISVIAARESSQLFTPATGHRPQATSATL